jgi:hypothetical protein
MYSDSLFLPIPDMQTRLPQSMRGERPMIAGLCGKSRKHIYFDNNSIKSVDKVGLPGLGADIECPAPGSEPGRD